MATPTAEREKANVWFTDHHTENLTLSFRVKGFLWSEKNKYQRIDVLETYEYGRILVLDGLIQLTERDEFIYHEMLVHPAMMTHPKPESVLIVGGGDGGAAREVLRHPTVRRVVQAELDERVVEVSKRFFPQLAASYSDPRHELVIADGYEFMGQTEERFDVVIVDSTDPVGEARKLFTRDFYSRVKGVLAQGGIAVSQAETPFLYPQITKGLYDVFKSVFRHVKLYLAFTPTYQSGMWGFVMGSDSPLEVDRGLLERRYAERGLGGSLKFYNPGVHLGLAELPNFLRDLISR